MSLDALTPSIKITIENADAPEGGVFGPGVAKLCRGVRDLGSLNAAAKQMGMAYSKAWRIMKDTERNFGVQLLNRDGAHGSTLTGECLALLSAYDALEAELQEMAGRRLPALIAESEALGPAPEHP